MIDTHHRRHHLPRAIAAMLLLALAAFAAGCGGGDDEEGTAKSTRSAAVSLQQAMDTAARAIDEVRGTRASLERLGSRLDPAVAQTGDVVALLTPKASEEGAEADLLAGARQQRTFLQYAQDAAEANSRASAQSALRRARTTGRQASATYARVARENPDLAGVVPAATSFNTGRLSDAIGAAFGTSGGSSDKDDDDKDGDTSGGSTGGGSTGGGSATTGPTDCGSGVTANAVTSCPFALNVAETYRASGGARQIEVFSPVTDRTYTMTCTGGAPVICRGGNNAVVYIR